MVDKHAWEEPGLHKVTDGVYRIPLPLPQDGLRAVNVYALADGDQVTLIDSGWALDVARTQLENALSQIGAGLGDVTRFLITHVHRDHYSQAVLLRRELGVPISAGAGERAALEYLNRPNLSPMTPQLTLLRATGATDVAAAFRAAVGDAQVDPAEWELADEWLADRQVLSIGERTVEVVETPGHTSGHVVFRDAEHDLLFAGDHVLPHITPSLGLEPVPDTLPLGQFLGSLKLVRELPDTWLLPAHGPVVESAHTRIDELLEHHRTRLDEALAAVRSGAATTHDVAKILRWTSRGRTLDQLDPFNAMLAVLETKAHLDLLVVQGRLRAETVDEVVYFALA